ncbi:MAG: hypothetical protein K8R87_09715 [Verrucomicrobia bacterium]|nr:hypothetical protein [Verrucomicrobiota bacterium]
MKIHYSLSLLAAGLAAITLSSCVVPTTEYAGGYYNPGYRNDDFYYYGGGAYPSYYNRSYGGYAAGYSYYRGSSACPICHHSPCSGHKGHSSNWQHSSGHYSSHQDHDNHHSSYRGSSYQNNNATQYERASGAPGKADGIHSKEWFLSRGYSPRQIEKSDGQINSSRVNDRDHDDKKKKHHDDDSNKKKH